MTVLRILEDAAERPRVFWWNGAVSEAALDEWIARGPMAGRCPADLRTFWLATGGGDLFETETIYGPIGEPTMDMGLLEANQWLLSRGMPTRYVAFANGTWVGAIDLDGKFFQLEREEQAIRKVDRFRSLDHWYEKTLRREYATRYGLA
jgi:hypothetical protein